MGSRLLWGLAVASAVVAFADLPDGAEGREAPGERQGDLSEGEMGTLRMIRITQYQKKQWKPYRVGSLSALSRGLVKTMSTSQEEREAGVHHQAREAGAIGAPGLGHCGAQPPSHSASRESRESFLLRS